MAIIAAPYKSLPSASLGGTAVGTTETVFQDSSSNAIVLPLPGGGEIISTNGKKSVAMRVIATGRVTTGGAITFAPLLYFGTSATVASNTKISNASGVSVSTASCPWRVEANLVWDVTSTKIQGWYTGVVNGTVQAITTLTNAITMDPDTNTANGFVMTGTFGTSNASNTSFLDSFVLEILREG